MARTHVGVHVRKPRASSFRPVTSPHVRVRIQHVFAHVTGHFCRHHHRRPPLPRVCTFWRTWLPRIVAFSRANGCEIERFSRFFLFRRARLLFRGIADALQLPTVFPEPLVEFRSVPRACRSTRHRTRARNVNSGAVETTAPLQTAFCLIFAADLLSHERKTGISFFLSQITFKI